MFCRDACNGGVARCAFGDHCTSADACAIANFNVVNNRCAGANVNVVANDGGFAGYVRPYCSELAYVDIIPNHRIRIDYRATAMLNV